MAIAEILSSVDMSGWPPKTWLIYLSEPLTRFDPATGQPDPHSHIALTITEAQTYVFPSDERGAFIDMTMTPMRSLTGFEFPHDALAKLGYTVS